VSAILQISGCRLQRGSIVAEQADIKIASGRAAATLKDRDALHAGQVGHGAAPGAHELGRADDRASEEVSSTSMEAKLSPRLRPDDP
jgi:hypothetical protein